MKAIEVNTDNVVDFIKGYNDKAPDWIREARAQSKELKALVFGDNFTELLINQIEQIESKEMSIARVKYSMDIRDLISRVFEPRGNVFSADGGSEHYSVENETLKKKIKAHLSAFKYDKSIEKYLSNDYFQLSDVDPNGLIFLEYKKLEDNEIEVYPTYKSINTIFDYDCAGQTVKWVLFKEEKTVENVGVVKVWRFVNSEVDIVVKQTDNSYVVQDELVNDFGVVPAVILSPIQKISTKQRLSWLYYVQELTKKYARDWSVKTIYEFLQGFPKHWRYVMLCYACKGSGKKDNGSCPTCDGRGEITKGDVTDDIRLPIPADNETPVLAPNIAGFISPDLETLKHMEESRAGLEDLIFFTLWGTREAKGGGNETATGRFLDVQPLINKLNTYSDTVEDVHNLLADFVVKLVDRAEATQNERVYFKTYGRRFIIESPDVLIERYNKAVEAGSPVTLLDKMFEEVISSKYKNDAKMRALMSKKFRVEPFRHLKELDIYTIFGSEQVQKKQAYSYWWENEANTDLDVKQLTTDFETWFTQQPKIAQAEQTSNQ